MVSESCEYEMAECLLPGSGAEKLGSLLSEFWGSLAGGKPVTWANQMNLALFVGLNPQDKAVHERGETAAHMLCAAFSHHRRKPCQGAWRKSGTSPGEEGLGGQDEGKP